MDSVEKVGRMCESTSGIESNIGVATMSNS